MNDRNILELLAERHIDDLFIPECKDGSTVFSSHLRLDAWVMKRTWSPKTCIGYEIKISRSDWLRDQKWLKYISLTNLFYLVCPQGIIEKQEVPSGVGLLWTTKNGNGLRTALKAQRREIEWPVDLLVYILMCRVKPGEARVRTRAQELAQIIKNFGFKSSTELGKRVAEEVGKYRYDVESRINSLEKREAKVKEFEDAATALGINIRSYRPDQELKDRLVNSYLNKLGRVKEFVDQLIFEGKSEIGI